MSLLNAHSKSKNARLSSYFALPRTTYEKFVNKKWCERKNIFETKQTFIERILPEWKSLTESERVEFLSAPAPKNHPMRIDRYFTEAQKSTNTKSTPTPTPTSRPPFPQHEGTQKSQESNQFFHIDLTDNAHSALQNRDTFLQSSELVLIKEFLRDIGFEKDFNDHVFKDSQFLKACANLSYKWKTFSELKRKYTVGVAFSKTSKLRDNLERIQKQTSLILGIVNRLTEIKVDDTMNSFALSRSYMQKAEIISEFITASATLTSLMNDRSLINALNRRIAQQKKCSSSYTSIFRRTENELLSFTCENNSKLTWNEVFETLIDMQNSNTNKFPIETSELIRVAQIISTNIVSHRTELQINSEAIEALVKLFPVLYVCNKDTECFINIHEFIYSPGILETLLFLPKEELRSPEAAEIFNDIHDTIDPENESVNNKGHLGQPSLVSKFPEIVDITTEFIKQHGFAAQCRRRSDTGNSSGVTASQIREHLYRTIPELKDHTISLSTIRRLFQAPNKKFNASSRYKGYVNARVGVKSNTYREYHEDAHYLFARNKYRRELASLFPKEIGILSIDDMSKIKVGAPAVSRYHQIKTFLPVNDQPNLNDHDFPVPGYLLGTSGYMFLEPKTNVVHEEILSSVYDQECTGHGVNDDFQNMQGTGVKGSLCEVLAHQLKIHLSIIATSEEILEEIGREAKKDSLDEDVHFQNNAINEMTDLRAAATLFLTDIIVFHGSNQHTVVKAKKSIEGPLYVMQHEDNSFESVTYKHESTSPFSVIRGLEQQSLKYDNLGRAHLPTPHAGPATLFVRSSKYNHSSIATHITDLYSLLRSEMDTSSRKSFMFVSDSGPDFSPSSVLNQLFLYRLFKSLDLDVLAVFTYAARYSAFNPIEHLWSLMSNKLSGTFLMNIYEKNSITKI